jgi:hypothetical protein
MCSAGPGAACPTKHKGCDDARKLLAHYSRCRDIRARQAGQNQKQHVCLVCTLVARHAKSILDRSRSTSPRKPNLTKHSISPFHPNGDGKVSIQCATPGSQFFQPSPYLSDSSPQMMPPPMPRVCDNTARRYIRSDSLDSAMAHSQTSFAFRPRAESLDVPHTHPPALFCKPSLHPYQHHDSPDLGLEVEQRGESSPDMLCEPRPNGRRRSASCTVFSTPSGTPLAFDTIVEEEVPVGREDNYDDLLNEY